MDKLAEQHESTMGKKAWSVFLFFFSGFLSPPAVPLMVTELSPTPSPSNHFYDLSPSSLHESVDIIHLKLIYLNNFHKTEKGCSG